MSSTPAEQIVWIDCEMTGLDIEKDSLCEIAIIVTNFDLEPLHSGFEVVINPGPEPLANMNDFVREMHKESGLLERIDSGLSMENAEKQALDYVTQYVTAGRRPLVAGNTIGMDRRFISKYMPLFDEKMHYRSIDVSTIKELSRRWHSKAYFRAPEKLGGHRALADIAESIRELAYFKETVIVPSPGPDSEFAKKSAELVTNRYEGITG
ncbi:MAG TPA: oligoribonuclease [Microbacteriaceae bacterium]|nr:oligoribonuclease [Microbacteriaceae bacterium]